jgi:hypothetical protein
LSDPADEDFVRGSGRAQWPSRKVGMIGVVESSTETARFFRLPE